MNELYAFPGYLENRATQSTFRLRRNDRTKAAVDESPYLQRLLFAPRAPAGETRGVPPP
jgi:hypothetical protein